MTKKARTLLRNVVQRARPRKRGTGGVMGQLYLEGYKLGLRHGWADAMSEVGRRVK